MRKILVILFISILISGCRTDSQGNQPAEDLTLPSGQKNANQPSSIANENEDALPSFEPEPAETLGPDCYGEDTHPIGQEIVDLYASQTDYQEVMVWFCNGFEFEDIITALQTAEDTDIPAQELLSKFEHGQTWEEIWREIGILEP